MYFYAANSQILNRCSLRSNKQDFMKRNKLQMSSKPTKSQIFGTKGLKCSSFYFAMIDLKCKKIVKLIVTNLKIYF